jgi:hypothetical protein
MGALSPEARQGVIGLMESRGGQIREEMAHQAARAELDDRQRDAFRTLAGARPEIRAQGISDYMGDSGSEQVAAPSTGTAATERRADPRSAEDPVEAPGATSPVGSPLVDRDPASPVRALPGQPDGSASIPASRGGDGSSGGEDER